jgi:hypothetical protein
MSQEVLKHRARCATNFWRHSDSLNRKLGNGERITHHYETFLRLHYFKVGNKGHFEVADNKQSLGGIGNGGLDTPEVIGGPGKKTR